MSLLKKLAGLAVGAAALGAAAYVLKNREHGEEYEHIVGPEDEVEPIYMPGLSLTASRPSSTWIWLASYS